MQGYDLFEVMEMWWDSSHDWSNEGSNIGSLRRTDKDDEEWSCLVHERAMGMCETFAWGWVRNHMKAYGSELVGRTTCTTCSWLFGTESWSGRRTFLQRSGRSFTFPGPDLHGKWNTSVSAAGITQKDISNWGGLWGVLLISSQHRWSRSRWGGGERRSVLLDFKPTNKLELTGDVKFKNCPFPCAGSQAVVTGGLHGWRRSSWLKSYFKRKNTQNEGRDRWSSGLFVVSSTKSS